MKKIVEGIAFKSTIAEMRTRRISCCRATEGARPEQAVQGSGNGPRAGYEGSGEEEPALYHSGQDHASRRAAGFPTEVRPKSAPIIAQYFVNHDQCQHRKGFHQPISGGKSCPIRITEQELSSSYPKPPAKLHSNTSERSHGQNGHPTGGHVPEPYIDGDARKVPTQLRTLNPRQPRHNPGSQHSSNATATTAATDNPNAQ